MIIDFNYSTKPFEDIRKYIITAIALCAVLGVVIFVNIYLFIDFNSNKSEMVPEIEFLQKKRADLTDNIAKKKAEIAQNRNREQEEEIDFLNKIIEAHAFSWTKLLNEMEKVVPPRVMVTSIKPKIDKEGITIQIGIKTEDYKHLLTLINKMNGTDCFVDLLPLNEAIQIRSGSKEIVAEFSVKYIPNEEKSTDDR